MFHGVPVGNYKFDRNWLLEPAEFSISNVLWDCKQGKMKISNIVLFVAIACACVSARFRGGRFSGSRNIGTFSSGSRRIESFGHKKGSSFGAKQVPHEDDPHIYGPGVPCNTDGSCDGDHEVCEDYLNTKLCFAKKDKGETCSGRFDLCQNSVCRRSGLRKVCVDDDNKAATGDICDPTSRPCLGTDVCKRCAWKFYEYRCVKMVDEGDECDLFEMCKSPLVCNTSAAKKKPVCGPCTLVCPPCAKANDDCTECINDPNAGPTCDPCGYDANGKNGNAVCAEMTGVTHYKCCPNDSMCTRIDGLIDTLLPSSVTWNPSTFICSPFCNVDTPSSCTTKELPAPAACTIGSAIALPDFPSTNAITEIPVCSCRKVCPKCYKVNADCTGCEIDDKSADDCNACDTNISGDEGFRQCARFGLGDVTPTGEISNQQSCCASDSPCVTSLNDRLTAQNLPTRAFVCANDCSMACDGKFDRACVLGDPKPLGALSPPDPSRIDTLPTCACKMDCPPCHKPNDFCTRCIFDWTAPENCNPCAEDPETGTDGDSRCAAQTGDYKMKCCSPASECNRPGGVIDSRLDTSFNPSTFTCSRDCDSVDCDTNENGLCSLYAEGTAAIQLNVGPDVSRQTILADCQRSLGIVCDP